VLYIHDEGRVAICHSGGRMLPETNHYPARHFAGLFVFRSRKTPTETITETRYPQWGFRALFADIYVADSCGRMIRKISARGYVTTLARNPYAGEWERLCRGYRQ